MTKFVALIAITGALQALTIATLAEIGLIELSVLYMWKVGIILTLIVAVLVIRDVVNRANHD